MKKKLWVFVLVLCCVLTCCFAFLGCSKVDRSEILPPSDNDDGKQEDNSQPSEEPRVELTSSQIYAKVNPSVVFIIITQKNGVASGSGFFIDTDGTIVTNYHVIADGITGVIQLHNGETATIVNVLGYDETLDIAVLSTTAKNTTAAKLGNSSQVLVGDTVYAIGYPVALQVGFSSSTFTTGMVSMNRSVGGYTYIQSTVDITHGNSGGTLINTYGEVIGITTAGLHIGDVDYMNLSIPVQRIDTVGRNVNESLEIVTKRHYPVYVTYQVDNYAYLKQTLKYEVTPTKPTNPTKTGYTFVNWYADKNCTKLFDFSEKIVADTLAYAKFSVNSYKITYNLSLGNWDGAAPKTTYTINDCNTELPKAKRNGYIFEGWKDSNGAFIDNFPASSNLQNITLTASWVQGTEGLTFNNSSVTGYVGSATNIIIPAIFRNKKIAQIDNNAFVAKTSIKSVVIADGIETIARGAFNGCAALTSITIPNSVNNIYSESFANCNNIKNVTIPMSALKYFNKNNLQNIELISGNSIENRLFFNCSSLTSITIPNSVTSIGDSAFSGCGSLSSITIPNSVTSIGDSAFSGCGSLRYHEYQNALYLGNNENPYAILVKAKNQNITSCQTHSNTRIILSDTFKGCSKLTTVAIGDKVTYLAPGLFSGCSSLTNITLPFVGARMESLPNTIQEPFGYIFGENSYTGAIAIQQSRSHGDSPYTKQTYYIPSSLKNVAIMGGNIPYEAFSGCSSLTKIAISNNVTRIGRFAFQGCDNLQYNVYNNDLYLGEADNPYVVLMEVTNKDITSYQVHSKTRFIGDSAFALCSSLTSIKIPNGVTGIGGDAFRQCSSLTSIDLPDSLTSIGPFAFWYCSSLTSITIPNSVTSIGYDAFHRCSSLTSINIPDSVTSIESTTFRDCSSLRSIIIPKSVTKMEANVFFGCYKVTVYCQVLSKPSGWNDSWDSIENFDLKKCSVVWGYKG